MNLLEVIARHGYLATAAALFLASCGLPLPLSVVLLTAGAASHGQGLNLGLVIAIGVSVALVGDTLMYLGGRFTGWWLLSALCHLSMNPETCVFGSARSFYRRGPQTLVFAKFVPGLATVAAPLAGSLNMRLGRFLRLDALGALLYVTVWSSLGYACAPVLRNVVQWVERVGHAGAALFGFIAVAYAMYLVACYVRDERSTVERVEAAELARLLSLRKGHDRVVVIADVRSHGYYDPKASRIRHSIRVEPNRLREELAALREFMAPECDIYLYCSCARDATSVRVARLLAEENCHTKVIRGGLNAWIRAGGELEPVPATDVEHLPRFD